MALAASLALGACDVAGSGGEKIPPGTAAELQGALSDLDGAAAADSCRDAREAVALFRERIEAMGEVSGEVREALVAGAVRLETLVQEELCVPSEITEPTTTTTAPETTTTTEPEDEKEEKEEEKEDKGKEEGEESTGPPEGEEGPNAPPGPEGNPGEDGGGDDGTGGTGAAGLPGGLE